MSALSSDSRLLVSCCCAVTTSKFVAMPLSKRIDAGEFAYSPSLQQATVTGTVTSGDGREIAVDLSWEGTGPLEVTQNTTTFPGFTGHFVGMRRDAVATGTVVVDGETVVDGSTTNARIESLEDSNVSTGAGA